MIARVLLPRTYGHTSTVTRKPYWFDYDAVRGRLEAAPARVIEDWAGFAHPFRAPVEPEWPAPSALRSDELSELRDRLGWDAWRLCLWTAAEMALPLFRSHAWRQQLDEHEEPVQSAVDFKPRSTLEYVEAIVLESHWMAAAHQVVAQAREVLWTGCHPLELYEAATEFFLIEHELLPQPGRYAWFAIRNALHGWTGGVRHLVQAWLAAQRIDPAERTAPSRAFAAWWERCRARLAFADAADAHTTSDAPGQVVQSVVSRAVASRHPRRSEASSLVLHWLNKSGDGRGTAPSADGPVSPPDEDPY